ncbi:uncharacterized protein CTRU02_204388 [Colletotrichum truncatum]|uniref:Uncharacterized protein n=1 Tax=Colletotrichum truncatum TaxID=5467 RepID=A0ACC3ZC79_COLTU|nr:uncharacterized protein CTRU02_13109 [Colletotrichum truncatum]KAF6783859.1 hypothetical protein CTRU02_13109 [Colletotrichum truncatum]
MPSFTTGPPAAKPASIELVERAASFTTVAQTLLRRLAIAIDPPSIGSLFAEVTPQLSAIINSPELPAGKARKQKSELDRLGTELWNLCTRLRRDDISGAHPSRKKLLLQSRAFAFFMIDKARFSKDDSAKDKVSLAELVHLMRLALKAGKMCIDDDNTRLAGAICLKGSDYNTALAGLQTTISGPDDLAECKRLSSEYFIMRTALCWKEGNLDVAEYMYNKGQPTIQTLDPSSAEKMTEVLFEIGKDLSKKKNYNLAVKWLERAYDIINSQELDRLPRDAVELRLAVGQAHVHALLELNTREASQKAHDLVSYIESEIGGKPFVLLLRLELLQKAPAEVFDVEAYADILRSMVMTFNFSEAHFKLLLYHARKLHDKSPTLASSMVNGMLKSTIASSGRDEWVERLVLLRIWMETNQRDNMNGIEELHNVLNRLQDNSTKPFEASAAVGALTKKVEVTYSQGHFDIADGWCRLALQPVFQNGGPANRSRLGRKLMLCALYRNDTEGARQAFNEMSEAAQNETMTRYLMYKVALQSRDRDLAAECLEHVGVAAPEDPNFLYACVLEAQKAGEKYCAAQAMKQLFERHEFSGDSPIHLPALLRSNIRLTVSIMDGEKDPVKRNAAVEEVVSLFEGDKDGNRLFTVKELDWFCQNAYNLGLKHSDSWNLVQLVRLFNCCLQITETYPADLPAESEGDLRFRRMFCSFVAAAALVSLARTEDNTEKQLQYYLDVRKHVEAYDTMLQVQIKNVEVLAAKDLTAKLATLLVFDFEAAVTLKNYDALGYILRLAASCKDVNALKAMGDIALRGQMPGKNLYTTLGVIVNKIWELEPMRCDKLAQYTRCMFQAVRLLDVECGKKVMQQAIDIARQAGKTPNPFPPEELEWLVATAFNQAVDSYNNRLNDECVKWADLAMNLAHHAGDDGALERRCQESRMKFNFNVE